MDSRTPAQRREGNIVALPRPVKTISPYYPESETGDELIMTSVQVPSDLHSHLTFIARLWNALDAARGVKRRSTWKPASVIRRLLLGGRDAIAETLGGIPESEKARTELIERMAKDLRDKAGKGTSS